MEEDLKRVLIIIDMQNDFSETGATPCEGFEGLIPIINKLSESKYFDKVYLSAEWHPENHISFITRHPGSKIGQSMKLPNIDHEIILDPPMCLQNQKGSEFHKDLIVKPTDFIVKKSHHPDIESYSAFGQSASPTELADQLKKDGIKEVYCVGVAYAFCVARTVMDATKRGYRSFLIVDAINTPSPSEELDLLEQGLKECDVIKILSTDILDN